MERLRELFARPEDLVVPLGLLGIVLLVGLAVRFVAFRLLARWTSRTVGTTDDMVVNALRTPSLLWIAAVSVHVAVGTSSFDPGVREYVGRLLGALIVISVTLALANVAVTVFRVYAGRLSLVATGLTETILKATIIALGAMLALGILGVNVTPLVTALGVGGLAVALGLQDTLSNLFAGIHVLLSEPIRVGDYVRLESGEEGFVTDIQWRYTRLRLLANNVVIVPNSKLAQSIITNYDRPQSELAVPVEVGVHYDSDLDQVERVTIEVAREVMRNVAGGVAEFEPFIRYHTFGESSIDFTAVLRGRGFTDQFLVKHEFVKRLRARYAAEGIVIPFPIRTLELPSEIEEKLRA
jgi:small-conductance mechanosensitive channel